MIAIQVKETGGAETLEMVDQAEPEIQPSHLVVAVAAAGVNFIDTYQRGGLYPMEMPFVLGMEGAGRVVEVGDGVGDVSVGDVVAWADVQGSYAQYALIPRDRAVIVPGDVAPETAAAAMLQGLTAHYLATSTFPLEAGHRCLIHAGAGGVGRLLIQIAKRIGAEVFTTVGSDEKAQVASAAGPDHVINYRQRPFSEAVEEIAGTRPLDVVYDGVGASTFEDGLGLLKRRGMMVSFGNASGAVPPISPLVLSRNGSLYLTRPTLGHYIGERPELEARAADLFQWIEESSLDVLVGNRYPLNDAAQAHQDLEGRATTGKSLLIP
ncbi:MAG TPA: quinone oxidoreductase [Acidimicrobiia bacterium]|nr:quinone oxidoreductase [Acidimicrobiia bacterium]